VSSDPNKFWALVHPGGPGGIVTEEPRFREQDETAAPTELYAVVFFPKITGIGDASIAWPAVKRTLAQTPHAAVVKFMDGIAKSERWETYQDAGHRIRKVRLVDLGDA
jgi:hypothetical protein